MRIQPASRGADRGNVGLPGCSPKRDLARFCDHLPWLSKTLGLSESKRNDRSHEPSMNQTNQNAKAIHGRNMAAVILCLFACTAMFGDAIGSRTVKGLGAVSAMAPFPKVFCEFEG